MPKLWKYQVQEMTNEIDSDIVSKLESLDIPTSTKHHYWTFIKKYRNYKDVGKTMWQTELNIQITEDEWIEIHTYPKKITRSSKLRYFQYRVVNKILTTNQRRHRWDKNVSDLCTFCQSAKEMVLHIMVCCIYTKKLWKATEKWLKQIYDIKCQLTPQDIILNISKYLQRNFVNIVILTMKQYIYASKCKQEIPNFIDFKSRLNNWYNTEKTAATFQMLGNKFSKIWSIYQRM